jgi:hypothetical protein
MKADSKDKIFIKAAMISSKGYLNIAEIKMVTGLTEKQIEDYYDKFNDEVSSFKENNNLTYLEDLDHCSEFLPYKLKILKKLLHRAKKQTDIEFLQSKITSNNSYYLQLKGSPRKEIFQTQHFRYVFLLEKNCEISTELYEDYISKYSFEIFPSSIYEMMHTTIEYNPDNEFEPRFNLKYSGAYAILTHEDINGMLD